MKKILLSAMLCLLAAVGAHAQANVSYEMGERNAQQFAYGWGAIPGAHVVIGNTATGTQTDLVCPAFRATADGRVIQIFSAAAPTPVSFDTGTGSAETVTPTSVSIVTAPSGVEADQQCAQITGSFSFAHAPSQNVGQVRSGSFGLQEALNDAGAAGGVVIVDNTWGGTNAMLIAATPWPSVSIADKRNGQVQYWSPQGAAAVIGTPATLTAVTALPSTTPVGTFTATNYNMCIAYVDIYGQEGTCSVTFVNTGAGATSSFIFSPPAASAGAVGYTIYIGLTGAGAGTLQYKVPLVTQPTVVGAYPVSNGVCVLTKVETTTPACAVANTTYGQATGATATVSAITVATSPIQPYTSIVSTTAIHVPNPGGRATYVYTPGLHLGYPGVPAAELVFPASGSAASTVPTVLGSVNIPPGFMNYVGRTLEICGKFGIVTGSTTTVLNLSIDWSSMGQDNAGLPVTVTNIGETPASAFSTKEMDSFCFDLQTTVAAATATGGSINTTYGIINTSGVVSAAAGQGGGADSITGATALLNLALDARVNIVYTHTTGTFAPTLQNLTVKVVN
jgi:hypothetical protein